MFIGGEGGKEALLNIEGDHGDIDSCNQGNLSMFTDFTDTNP